MDAILKKHLEGVSLDVADAEDMSYGQASKLVELTARTLARLIGVPIIQARAILANSDASMSTEIVHKAKEKHDILRTADFKHDPKSFERYTKKEALYVE